MERSSPLDSATRGPFLLSEDERLRIPSRRIVVISVIIALWNVVSAVFSAFTRKQHVWETVVTFFLGLVIPCCGFWSARHTDGNVASLFSCCNCLGAAVSIFNVVLLTTAIGSLAHFLQTCDPQEQGDGCPTDAQWRDMCKSSDVQLGPNDSAEECYLYLTNHIGLVRSRLAVSAGFALLAMLFDCIGFVWGVNFVGAMSSSTAVQPPPASAQTTVTLAQPLQNA